MNLVSISRCIYFKDGNLSITIAPLLREVDICAQWLFCMKFNFAQFLFEQFFDIIDNFDSLQPKNESTFPVQYTIIFETYRSFEHPSSTPGRDRDVRLLTFLYEIQF